MGQDHVKIVLHLLRYVRGIQRRPVENRNDTLAQNTPVLSLVVLLLETSCWTIDTPVTEQLFYISYRDIENNVLFTILETSRVITNLVLVNFIKYQKDWWLNIVYWMCNL